MDYELFGLEWIDQTFSTIELPKIIGKSNGIMYYNTFCISIDLSFSYTYVPLPESASSPDDLTEPPGAATTPELSEVSVSPKKIIT